VRKGDGDNEMHENERMESERVNERAMGWVCLSPEEARRVAKETSDERGTERRSGDQQQESAI